MKSKTAPPLAMTVEINLNGLNVTLEIVGH